MTKTTANALGVIVTSPTTGKLLREADPKAFEQAVRAYWQEINDGTPLWEQSGNNCNGCAGELVPGEFGFGLKSCSKCGGVGNTGFGDHIEEVTYGEIFAGFESEPEGSTLRYFDISTVNTGPGDGCEVTGAWRHHGWFWTDKAGQNWIAQTG
jgi:hypothetical protein